MKESALEESAHYLLGAIDSQDRCRIETAIMRIIREYDGLHVYSLREIKDGTGFSRGATFVQIVQDAS